MPATVFNENLGDSPNFSICTGGIDMEWSTLSLIQSILKFWKKLFLKNKFVYMLYLPHL
jgi:hypothetical protein